MYSITNNCYANKIMENIMSESKLLPSNIRNVSQSKKQADEDEVILDQKSFGYKNIRVSYHFMNMPPLRELHRTNYVSKNEN
jgi:hypothetical protein